MDVAVFHHLPTGGALRVLAEWTKRTAAARITVYTHDPSVHRFAPLAPRVEVVALEPARPTGVADALRLLARNDRRARAAAALIDAGRHDVVFALPDQLTQAPAAIGHLRTRSVYYSPEPLRTAYEPRALLFPGNDTFDRLSRRGLNPVERARKILDRRAMAGIGRTITHSRFTADQLERIYAVRAEVVPPGVSAKDFAEPVGEEPTNAEAVRPYVLAVGALHPLKGHDLVIDAMAALPKPAPRLVIVGDRGVIAPALEERAVRRGVDLDLREGLPFGELVALYRGAAVVACGQRLEPFGLVPLEAMAAGRAVVAVDEGGFRETVRHGETGMLSPRDPADFAALLHRILNDPPLAGRLGAAGLAAVRADWTWEAYATRVDAILAAEAQSSARA
jgi:glycosyltransferase involved in cell wall biosynthesis